MKNNRARKFLFSTVLGIGCMGFVLPTYVYADGTKTVTLGADLSEEQKDLVLSYFGITDENEQEYNFIEVNNQEERDALEDIIPLEQIGTRTYSCACIEPTDDGGINVETTNLTYVTDNMIASALTTAGVTNCNVKAASPFNVSGTGALTGAIKAYEVATDEELSEEKKDIANEEIKTSVDLADEIGQDNTTIIINDAKENVIEQSENKDLTEEDVKKIVEDTLEDNNVTLNDESVEELTGLLRKISEQEYDVDTVKNNLDKVSEKLNEASEKLNEAASNLTSEENQEKAKGFFEQLMQSIKDFFNSLFGNETTGVESNTAMGNKTTEVESDTEMENETTEVESDTEMANETTGVESDEDITLENSTENYDFSTDSTNSENYNSLQ